MGTNLEYFPESIAAPLERSSLPGWTTRAFWHHADIARMTSLWGLLAESASCRGVVGFVAGGKGSRMRRQRGLGRWLRSREEDVGGG